jgi:hydrogenase nickel incorporation protein HypB
VEIDVSRPILERNDTLAAGNRARLAAAGVFALDVLASPGAGKTTTILATLAVLGGRFRTAVIEGDIASRVDAEKVKASGVMAVQINTGGACHLEADMISRALDALPLEDLDLVVIENVGNLVCPIEFDLGQSARIVIASVPEGDDKPLKYPSIFAVSDAVLLNKVDAASVFDFDVTAFADGVRNLNGIAPIFRVSAKTGEGIAEWAEWLSDRVKAARSASS